MARRVLRLRLRRAYDVRYYARHVYLPRHYRVLRCRVRYAIR